MAYDGNWKTSSGDADAIVRKWFSVGMGRPPMPDELAKWSSAVRTDGSNTAYKDFSGQISKGYAGDERTNAAKKIAASGWNGYELNKGQGQLAGTAGRTGAAGFVDRNREGAATALQYASPFISMLLPGAGSLLNAALTGGLSSGLSSGIRHGTNIGDIGKATGIGAATGAATQAASNVLGGKDWLGRAPAGPTVNDIPLGAPPGSPPMGAPGPSQPAFGPSSAPIANPIPGLGAPPGVAAPMGAASASNPAFGGPNLSSSPFTTPFNPGPASNPLANAFGGSNLGPSPFTTPFNPAGGTAPTPGGGFWKEFVHDATRPEVLGGLLKGIGGMGKNDAETEYLKTQNEALAQRSRLEQQQYDAQVARAKALQPLLDALMGKAQGIVGQPQGSVAPNPYLSR